MNLQVVVVVFAGLLGALTYALTLIAADMILREKRDDHVLC